MKSLSRNLPTTLLVGAAGFIGSHLTRKLLDKNIQVIGLDDLSIGTLDNLNESSNDRHFHFLNRSIFGPVNLDLPRLDYAVFILPEKIPQFQVSIAIDNFLRLCSKFTPKILLVSTIDLYSSNHHQTTMETMERTLVNQAAKAKINARIVRLSMVYGPKMHFREIDPIAKLIAAASKGELQKDIPALDFSTRAIYIADAVNLLIKSLLHGGTAHKIYDGVMPVPVKITEVKQILLDPVWYENTKFEPTKLPPWPTPNLAKTEQELHWKANTPIATALKETVKYFKQHPEKISSPVISVVQKNSEKLETQTIRSSDIQISSDKKKPPQLDFGPIIRPIKKHVGLVLGVVLIVYGLVVPLVDFMLGSLMIKQQLSQVASDIEVGEFSLAGTKLDRIKQRLDESENIKDHYLAFQGIRLAAPNFGLFDDLFRLDQLLYQSAIHGNSGVGELAQSWGKLTGGVESDVLGVESNTDTNFSSLINSLGLSKLQLASSKLILISSGFKQLGFDLGQTIDKYQQLASLLKSSSALVTVISKRDGHYLVSLVDDRQIREGGGVVLAVADVEINQGQIKAIHQEAASTLDKQLTEIIEPPEELKNDLGVNSWSLKDSLSEINFPDNAENLMSFYKYETGVSAQGLIQINLSAVRSITSILHLSVPATLDNQSAKLLLGEMVNRLVYVPQTESFKLYQEFGRSLDNKEILIYLKNSQDNLVVTTANWGGGVRVEAKQDTLMFSESSIGDKPVSDQIKREVKLVGEKDKNGKFSYKLTINYINPTAFDYKFRFKLFTPLNKKLINARMNNSSIMTQLTNFSDYQLAGYSTLISLKSQDNKTLTFELLGEPADKLLLIKQSGMLPIPLSVSLGGGQRQQIWDKDLLILTTQVDK